MRFALNTQSSTLFAHSADFENEFHADEGIAVVQICNTQFELGEVAELGGHCFVVDGDYIELTPRLLTCYFAHECDDAAEWPHTAFANSSGWINSFSYGDVGQCRSVSQTTSAHLVTGGTAVQPNMTLATQNYTVQAADDTPAATGASVWTATDVANAVGAVSGAVALTGVVVAAASGGAAGAGAAVGAAGTAASSSSLSSAVLSKPV